MEAKQQIYISGKITGNKDYIEQFNTAEEHLRSLGHSPLNPIKLNHYHDKSWNSYMKEDIRHLCLCDSIYMLKNWHESKGARIEKSLAYELGLKIINEK